MPNPKNTEFDKTQAKLLKTQAELDKFTHESNLALLYKEGQINKLEIELKVSQMELRQTQTELKQTQTELRQTQTKLKNKQLELDRVLYHVTRV
jgi:hypothetical protein